MFFKSLLTLEVRKLKGVITACTREKRVVKFCVCFHECDQNLLDVLCSDGACSVPTDYKPESPAQGK